MIHIEVANGILMNLLLKSERLSLKQRGRHLRGGL